MTSPNAQCPHERRPGTTVCLHCRHEELETARRRRRHFASRAGVIALGLGVFAIFGVAGANAVQSRLTRSTSVSTRSADSTKSADRTRSKEATPTRHPAETNERSFSVSQASSGARDIATFTPVIPEGRSELGDSVFAVRQGTNLAVHFDTPLTRTRRRDKFEQIVRATLPKVLGPAADSMLAHLPQGSMASGDLVSELTQRGIRLPAHAGYSVVVWPETRPGQDGPLVVSYRLTVGR